MSGDLIAWLALIVALLAGNLFVNAGVWRRLGTLCERTKEHGTRLKTLEGKSMATRRMKAIKAAQAGPAEVTVLDSAAPAPYQVRVGDQWVKLDGAGNELARKKGPPWRGLERRVS